MKNYIQFINESKNIMSVGDVYSSNGMTFLYLGDVDNDVLLLIINRIMTVDPKTGVPCDIYISAHNKLINYYKYSQTRYLTIEEYLQKNINLINPIINKLEDGLNSRIGNEYKKIINPIINNMLERIKSNTFIKSHLDAQDLGLFYNENKIYEWSENDPQNKIFRVYLKGFIKDLENDDVDSIEVYAHYGSFIKADVSYDDMIITISMYLDKGEYQIWAMIYRPEDKKRFLDRYVYTTIKDESFDDLGILREVISKKQYDKILKIFKEVKDTQDLGLFYNENHVQNNNIKVGDVFTYLNVVYLYLGDVINSDNKGFYILTFRDIDFYHRYNSNYPVTILSSMDFKGKGQIMTIEDYLLQNIDFIKSFIDGLNEKLNDLKINIHLEHNSNLYNYIKNIINRIESNPEIKSSLDAQDLGLMYNESVNTKDLIIGNVYYGLWYKEYIEGQSFLYLGSAQIDHFFIMIDKNINEAILWEETKNSIKNFDIINQIKIEDFLIQNPTMILKVIEVLKEIIDNYTVGCYSYDIVGDSGRTQNTHCSPFRDYKKLPINKLLKRLKSNPEIMELINASNLGLF